VLKVVVILYQFYDSALNCIDLSFRFLSQRRESQPVMKIPKLTKKMIVVSAFFFGRTPRRTLEKTYIGKVVEPLRKQNWQLPNHPMIR
jgi:hypothetical protein